MANTRVKLPCEVCGSTVEIPGRRVKSPLLCAKCKEQERSVAPTLPSCDWCGEPVASDRVDATRVDRKPATFHRDCFSAALRRQAYVLRHDHHS